MMELSIMPIRYYKQVAKSYRYEMWYDRSLRLWTLTRDGWQTMYYPSKILKNLPLLIFISEIDINEKVLR